MLLLATPVVLPVPNELCVELFDVESFGVELNCLELAIFLFGELFKVSFGEPTVLLEYVIEALSILLFVEFTIVCYEFTAVVPVPTFVAVAAPAVVAVAAPGLVVPAVAPGR